MAYLLSRRDRIAASLDGAFAPVLSTFLVDRMLQDPKAVSLRWSDDGGARNKWLIAVAQALKVAEIPMPAEDVLRVLQPLDVARAVYSFIAALPPWTMRTARLGTRGQRLRVAIKNARDPLTLLLDEVPSILGGSLSSPKEAEDLARSLAEELRILGSAYSRLLADVTDTIRQEFKVEREGGLKGLQDRARAVRGVTGDLRLDALAVHLEVYDGAPEQTEAVAALAVHKPARDWTDRDVDAARLAIAELAQRFMKAEALAHVQGRADTVEVIALVSSAPSAPAPLIAEVRLSRTAEAAACSLLAGIEALIAKNAAASEVQVAALVRALTARIGQVPPVKSAPVRREAQ
jgi:hypothetical protein